MSAAKSHITPPAVFGLRVREMRERRGWTQAELARRLYVDRTTVNKIEKGTRGDVTIRQLFAFADALGTSPVYLLTPGEDEANVEITERGRVVTATEARGWIRGLPAAGADPLDFFLDLPKSEQRSILRRQLTPKNPLIAALAGDETEAALDRALAEVLENAKRRRGKTG